MPNKKLLYILLIVLAMFAATAAGFFVVKNENPPIITPTPSPTPNPNAAPFPSPTPAQTPNPPPPTYPNQIDAEVGKQFTLKKGQIAIVDTMSIEVTAFFNSPCPKDAVCIWSGVGTAFQIQLERDVVKGMDSLDAFGYHIEVVKSDHETYADFLVQRVTK